LRGETHDIPDAEHADDRSLFLERDLWASLSGNLECDGIGKTAFDLIHERTVQLARERPVQKGHELRATILATLREDEMTLKRPPERICTANTELLWEAEGGVYMRAVCEGHGPSMTLLAYNVGSDAVRNSVLYDALRQVNTGIARLDVRGIGISATSGAEPNGAFLTPLLQNSQANLARMALQQGRTLTGMRTVDMLQAATVLRSSAAEPLIQKKVETVNLMANSGIGFAALLAAVLAPETFRRVILYRTPLRWQELTTGTNRVFNFPHFLYGVLERFDTPDLTRALSPDRLIWINPVDGAGNVVPESEAISAHRGGQVAFRYARTEQELVGILNAALG